MFGNSEDHAGEKFVAPADFDGPTKNRHCTDLLCLILIWAHWICLTGIGIYAVQNGDYRLVLYPLDYDGNVCGTDYAANMTEYPKLLYVNSYTGGVCVKECPDLTNKTSDGLTDIRTLITYNGTWQIDGAELALDDYVDVADYSKSNDTKACTSFLCYPNNSSELSWNSLGIRQSYGYAYYAATTYEVLGRCYVTTEAEDKISQLVNAANSPNATDVVPIDNPFENVYDFWNKLYADIYIARKYVFGFGFGVSLVISLVYIFLMRFPGLLTSIIWLSILLTIALFGAGGYYAYNQATIWDDANPKTVEDKTIHATTIFAYVLWGIAGFLIVMACCLRKSIQDAIVCTKQAGKAVNSMVMILLVPVVQSIGFLLYLIPFMFYGINLASMATITTTDIPLSDAGGTDIAVRTYTFDSFVKQCGWYLLFSLFWTGNFIVAVGDMIVAVSVAKWYFARNKLLIGSWTVLFSIFEVCFYHTGTCAFGSLIIAIVQLIRTIIAKAQKKAKEAGSKIAQILLCCCQCFFWCLECCLKFVNKNAYIQTAIFSTSFCTSCRESFGLIFRNAGRIAAVSYVSAAVLIVGKLFISTVVTLLGYYFIVENLSNSLSSVGGPVAMIFLISYWISDMFMDVLDIGILTVLHCFIADEEMFESHERYHEHEFKEFVDKHGGYEPHQSHTSSHVGRSVPPEEKHHKSGGHHNDEDE